MKPSQIEIKKGALVPQLKKSIGSLAKLLGKMGIANISGAVEVTQTPDGLDIFVKGGGVSSSEAKPFFVSRPYNSSGWKVNVRIGTLNGGTPVVGDVEGSGGSAMTASTVLTLNTGEPYICLGVKTDLETRAISRLTLQTREDIAAIVDTGARTRIAFIVLAELTEVVTPAESWSKLTQSVTTNLNYFTAGNSDFPWRT